MSLKDLLNDVPSIDFDGHLLYQQTIVDHHFFQEKYLELRQKEGRLYNDDVVKKLPSFHENEGVNFEWKVREATTRMIVKYLRNRTGLETIMDLGCGNGWLSNIMANALNGQVVGVDVNILELRQAARVFSKENLIFLYGDVMSLDRPNCFDAIVLAGSVQYFPNLPVLIKKLYSLLRVNGQIHILDSPIYKSEAETYLAKKRSQRHFESMGTPEMNTHYFHHSFEGFNGYDLEINFDPRSISNLIKRKVLRITQSPFPWIVVTKTRG